MPRAQRFCSSLPSGLLRPPQVRGPGRSWWMKSCLVLWEVPHWNKMARFEFQLLYVSPAHLLVVPLMSSKPANREEEEEAAEACSGADGWPDKPPQLH